MFYMQIYQLFSSIVNSCFQKKENSTVASKISVGKGGKTLPFSSEEIANLKTGYGRYGARWKTILGAFKFQQGRTAQDLRNRYTKLSKVC